ncbi:hypothetical protein [Acinetobacter lwoffii]|uniref:hypothetical protein n=1 Tax=Acinetobacter lwoffii TaxID=28090 RepID=UPI00209A7FD8|nr:hypothetical protein [Acinetobacter lwoffii]MCO8062149.1 hypothetical protein [Acinetobacter lwoffii]
MNYHSLKTFILQVLNQADHLQIPYKLYWYSPLSRKLNPNSKIGSYDTQPFGIKYERGCKLVITFPRLAFNSLQPIINRYLPHNKQLRPREDYKSDDFIGFDVYQRVDKLKLYIEPGSKESDDYTIDQILEKEEDFKKAQLKVVEDLSPLQQMQVMGELEQGIANVLSYLESQNNPNAKVQITRVSGVRHRMIRVDLAGNKTKRKGFSDLVLVFGTTHNLPHVELPKPPKPNRKQRSDSIAAMYKANPSSFKYYDSFGIFEVYDK